MVTASLNEGVSDRPDHLNQEFVFYKGFDPEPQTSTASI